MPESECSSGEDGRGAEASANVDSLLLVGAAVVPCSYGAVLCWCANSGLTQICTALTVATSHIVCHGFVFTLCSTVVVCFANDAVAENVFLVGAEIGRVVAHSVSLAVGQHADVTRCTFKRRNQLREREREKANVKKKKKKKYLGQQLCKGCRRCKSGLRGFDACTRLRHI